MIASSRRSRSVPCRWSNEQVLKIKMQNAVHSSPGLASCELSNVCISSRQVSGSCSRSRRKIWGKLRRRFITGNRLQEHEKAELSAHRTSMCGIRYVAMSSIQARWELELVMFSQLDKAANLSGKSALHRCRWPRKFEADLRTAILHDKPIRRKKALDQLVIHF